MGRQCSCCAINRQPPPSHRRQVWLLLYNLLADGAARARMDMTEGRCEALLRLRRHFNELLFDQVRCCAEAFICCDAQGRLRCC